MLGFSAEWMMRTSMTSGFRPYGVFDLQGEKSHRLEFTPKWEFGIFGVEFSRGLCRYCGWGARLPLTLICISGFGICTSLSKVV